MNRSLALLASSALFAVTASAQCFTVGAGTSIAPAGADDSLSAETALGINFPMAGALGTPYTHCIVSTNGVMYLTNGLGATGASGTAYGSTAQFQGVLGDSPRIAPFWDDLWDANANWDITIESTATTCTVRWLQVVEWNSTGNPKDFSVELSDTGAISISFGSIANLGTCYTGVSIGDGVADPGSADLSTSPLASTGLVYETFVAGAFDLGDSTILFSPNGVGYDVSTSCQAQPASHTNFGAGCYNLPNSVYQQLADAAVAGPALSGNALLLTPNANGNYDAAWLAGAAASLYVAPTGVALGLSDDGEVTYTSAGFPTPFGAVTDIRVNGNGIIGLGATPLTFAGGNNYEPTVPKFIGGTVPAIYSWHDYNVSEGGSIIAEDVVGMTLVTFDNVESYSSPAGPNPSTLQFQFDQTTGSVTIVWLSVDADASSVFGSAHLVGFKPASSTVDGGSIDLAAAGSVSASATEVPAISMSASPAPVSTSTTGTTVTYQVDNIPHANGSSGVHIGAVVLSTVGNIPGTELSSLGMPGCNAYVGAIVVILTDAAQFSSSSQAIPFVIPPGVPPGVEVFAQGAALFFPGSLVNGQNAAGVVTSNGVQSFISVF